MNRRIFQTRRKENASIKAVTLSHIKLQFGVYSLVCTINLKKKYGGYPNILHFM
jgi:hypothetical protein